MWIIINLVNLLKISLEMLNMLQMVIYNNLKYDMFLLQK